MIATAAPRKRTRTFGKHAWLSVLGGLLMALTMVGLAEAYWAAGGTGTGSGPVGTLTAPTITDAVPGAGTVALSWSAAGTPSGSPADSYFVTRNPGPGSVRVSCAGPISDSSCTDSGLTAGTYNYTVTAVWQSWTATSASRAVTVIGPPFNTALPVISGTAVQGETLTADPGTWDNLPTGYSGYTYQWRRCNSTGLSCSNIGANSSSYVLKSGDVGSTIRVVVTAANYGSTAATSVASGTVTGLPLNVDPPIISGAAEAGQRLSTDNGIWTNSPSSYTYQWQRCDSAGGNCSNISGATASTYLIPSGDVGATISVVVTATNSYGSTDATSDPTAVVVVAGALTPVNTTPPSISGTPQVGKTLTADPGVWTNSPTYTYQWRLCGPNGSNCSDISGATSNKYVVQLADSGHTIRVVVTATNANGSTPATSLRKKVH